MRGVNEAKVAGGYCFPARSEVGAAGELKQRQEALMRERRRLLVRFEKVARTHKLSLRAMHIRRRRVLAEKRKHRHER